MAAAVVLVPNPEHPVDYHNGEQILTDTTQ
jgi:hypothetical protein